jgi:hypothetical protein
MAQKLKTFSIIAEAAAAAENFNHQADMPQAFIPNGPVSRRADSCYQHF